MMHENGRMLMCDRCGKSIFTKFVGTDVHDGGFTRIDRFEKPEGWSGERVDGEYRDLCPDCNDIYLTIKERRKQEWKRFMKGEQHGE